MQEFHSPQRYELSSVFWLGLLLAIWKQLVYSLAINYQFIQRLIFDKASYNAQHLKSHGLNSFVSALNIIFTHATLC